MAYSDDSYEDAYYGSGDEDLHPEGPSGEDLRRLDRSMGRCPSCGAEVYDEAQRCPACDEWIVPRGEGGGKLWTFVGVVVIVVFVLAWVV